MTAASAGGPLHRETIEEMDKELTNVIEDFDRALLVETHSLAKRSGKRRGLNLGIVRSHWFCVERAECERVQREQEERERAKQERAEREREKQEQAERERAAQERAEQELLYRRLKPVETSYRQDSRCMDGTRQSLLNRITAWVTEGEDQKGEGNTLWIYGLPGIGKTSLAHSACASLHDGEHLAGAFFCRRDDLNLNEPRYILPTLIHKLAIIFPPFRSLVAQNLRNDPNLTPESMKYSLFVDLICKLHYPPQRTLVFVIDAFDECGDAQSRPTVLRTLIDAATRAPWLKIIVTSRPEDDIQRSFATLAQLPHLRYDLAADQDATSDLRIFAQNRFSKVATMQGLRAWPEQMIFDGIISRAAGLFIFIDTIARALEKCEDPTERLRATLQDSVGTGMTALYGLYSSILRNQILHSYERFRQVIGVLLATGLYRPLCEETIAELAGVRDGLVRIWVAGLSSLLYRDEGANGGVRIRHLSVSDFFISSDCHGDYRVNLHDVNVQLGITCLKTMVEQLRFNICNLEDSRIANADIQDLSSRIRQNISDPLQYGCIYWSNHLCFTPKNGDSLVQGVLNEFFEGPYALFWIEVLSIMGMVSIGVPSLRRVILIWGRVSCVS